MMSEQACTMPASEEGDVPYDLIFDNAIVGICFVRDRHLIKVNPKMEEMFGYASGELTGKSVRMFYADEDDYNAIGKLFPTIIRNGGYVYEKPLIRKNGEIIWCLISGSIIRRDTYASSFWIVQDINARKTAENQLRRSKERLSQIIERRTLHLQRTNLALKEEILRRKVTEREKIESREKYRALFRHIPMGILATDEGGKVIEINPAMRSMTGTLTLSEFERVACDPNRVTTTEGTSISLNELIRAKSPLDGRRVERAHIQWQNANGSQSENEVIGIRISTKEMSTALVFQDTTDQYRARQREHEQQQQLAHATRVSLMGQFASALAHELGQPLNACQSYLAGLRHHLAVELKDRAQIREAVDRLGLHLSQAGDIVRNVRSFVTRHRPDDEAIELPVLIARTLDLLCFQLRAGSTRVDVQSTVNLPTIRGNRVEIQQVLINLVMNAVDALQGVPEDRRIIVIRMAVECHEHIAVRVSDNGVGIPRESFNKVFEPYYTTKPGGLGLGLMMCRTIIESHGGTLKLVASPRGGTTFKFQLPIAAQEEEHESTTNDCVFRR